ncbi:hypothetical protein K474DRAFT_1356506 [Panus rudis PR-1116 ss-1]|nr:hypothetical protein K474DRAFT_1356506 [Panus rudis PR-1116 ss-1]
MSVFQNRFVNARESPLCPMRLPLSPPADRGSASVLSAQAVAGCDGFVSSQLPSTSRKFGMSSPFPPGRLLWLSPLSLPYMLSVDSPVDSNPCRCLLLTLKDIAGKLSNGSFPALRSLSRVHVLLVILALHLLCPQVSAAPQARFPDFPAVVTSMPRIPVSASPMTLLPRQASASETGAPTATDIPPIPTSTDGTTTSDPVSVSTILPSSDPVNSGGISVSLSIGVAPSSISFSQSEPEQTASASEPPPTSEPSSAPSTSEPSSTPTSDPPSSTPTSAPPSSTPSSAPPSSSPTFQLPSSTISSSVSSSTTSLSNSISLTTSSSVTTSSTVLSSTSSLLSTTSTESISSSS